MRLAGIAALAVSGCTILFAPPGAEDLRDADPVERDAGACRSALLPSLDACGIPNSGAGGASGTTTGQKSMARQICLRNGVPFE